MIMVRKEQGATHATGATASTKHLFNNRMESCTYRLERGFSFFPPKQQHDYLSSFTFILSLHHGASTFSEDDVYSQELK